MKRFDKPPTFLFLLLSLRLAATGYVEERHRSDRTCSLGGADPPPAELGPNEICSIMPLEGFDSRQRMLVKFGETGCKVGASIRMP
jgi:hypothetical protein